MSLYLLVRLQIAAAFLFFLLGSGSTAPLFAQRALSEPETLVFDNAVTPGNADATGLEIGPRLIASQRFHTVSLPDAGLLRFVNNGTPFIASVGGGLDYPITLERFDGSPFSLVSFDAAEGFLDDLLAAEEGFVGASRIEVEAALATGFTVTLEFGLDGQRDGSSGANDFETLAMLDALENVTSVTFTGLAGNRRDAGFALDNIVVAAVVPEPSGATLAILGGLVGAILCATARRRSRIGV